MLEVTDIVYYGLDSFNCYRQTWRICQFYKKQTREEFEKANPIEDFILKSILDQLHQEEIQKRKENNLPINSFRYLPCTPEEATHVGLTAICGRIVPISEVEFIKKMDSWNPELIELHKKSASQSINLNCHHPWMWE